MEAICNKHIDAAVMLVTCGASLSKTDINGENAVLPYY